jgi:hypothetical protein
MVATCELVAGLCSISIPYASEASLSNEDGTNNISDNPDKGLAHHHATMTVEGIMQFLTHTERNMLSQTLLLSWGCGGWGGGALVCHRWQQPQPRGTPSVAAPMLKGVAPQPHVPPPANAFLGHGEGPQDGVPPALGNDGDGGGDGAYGEEIGMIRIGNSKW